jgi:hypothetical protein
MFGVALPESERGPQILWFSCTDVVGLLVILQQIAPQCTVPQRETKSLHSMVLLEDSTFGLYSAKYGEQPVGLKVLSSMGYFLFKFVL